MRSILLAIRFAGQEMRSGLRGFLIFFCCIALGVTAITSLSAISTMIADEFSHQGRTLLGGDMRVTMTQGEASPAELAFFEKDGRVASSIWTRSMVRTVESKSLDELPDAGSGTNNNSLQEQGMLYHQQVIEIKAVDAAYPLYGTFKTVPAGDFQSLFGLQNGVQGIVVAPALLQRLGVQIGDHVEIGNQIFAIRAVVENEPDILSEGLQLGLRVFMAQEALVETGLLQEGSLHARIYKIAASHMTDSMLESWDEQLKQEFSQRTWNIRNRLNAAPALEVNINRFLQFLTLVGLTALIVGGTGVAQAVRVYLQEKREVIAIFKTLGASGNFIAMVYLLQILMIGFMAIFVGMIFGVLIPVLFKQIIQNYLPLEDVRLFYPLSLLTGAAFAFLTIVSFAIVPLGYARITRVTSLFRAVDDHGRLPFFAPIRLLSVAALLLIAGFAVMLGNDRRLSLIFIGALAGVFLVLKLLDVFIELIAKRLSHSRFLEIRLAFGNICRRNSLTSAVVRALGLGLTLLVALTTLDGNLRNQLSNAALDEAPAFFFLDVPGDGGEELRSHLGNYAPDGKIEMMPILRARITQLKGIPAQSADIDEDGRWVLRGDRNVGFSQDLPDGARLSKGTWWERDYSGFPLVSFSNREAQRLKLTIGDMITVNVLGRLIEARIANLREVDWDSMKMNFVMIFSPNTFSGAPYTYLATLTMMPDEKREAEIANSLGKKFPMVTVLSTRDILQNAREIAEQIGQGVRACALIVIISSILVLAGALSASNRSRAQMVVILKILGASRKTLIQAFVLEYAILGVTTAIFAFIVGSAAGVGVARLRMNLSQATVLPESGIMVLLAALIFSIGPGLVGTWRILGQKPVSALREL